MPVQPQPVLQHGSSCSGECGFGDLPRLTENECETTRPARCFCRCIVATISTGWLKRFVFLSWVLCIKLVNVDGGLRRVYGRQLPAAAHATSLRLMLASTEASRSADKPLPGSLC